MAHTSKRALLVLDLMGQRALRRYIGTSRISCARGSGRRVRHSSAKLLAPRHSVDEP